MAEKENDELAKELQKLFAYTNATHVSPEPVFQGTGAQLAPVFNRLGILPKVEIGLEQPGWLDNLANAIVSDNSVLLESNNLAPWYEIGRRGSVLTTIGDYVSFFLNGANTLLNSADTAREKIGSEIKKVKEKYAVQGMKEYIKDLAEYLTVGKAYLGAVKDFDEIFNSVYAGLLPDKKAKYASGDLDL